MDVVIDAGGPGGGGVVWIDVETGPGEGVWSGKDDAGGSSITAAKVQGAAVQVSQDHLAFEGAPERGRGLDKVAGAYSFRQTETR